MFSSGFFVIHDSAGSGHNDESELTGRKEIVGPLFDIVDGHVESRGDNSAFVESSGQVNDDFTASVIVDDFEFSDVTVFHHDG